MTVRARRGQQATGGEGVSWGVWLNVVVEKAWVVAQGEEEGEKKKLFAYD